MIIKLFFILILIFLNFPSFSQILDDPVSLTSSNYGITQLIADNMQNLFALAYISDQNIYFSYSTNYGERWESFIQINENPSKSINMTIGEDKTIILIWIEQVENDFILKLKRCENNCSFWSESIIIANNVIPYDQPAIKYKSGKIYVVYSKAGIESSYITFLKSTDKGDNWSNEKILNNNIEGSNTENPLGWKSDMFIIQQKIYVARIEGKDFYSIAFAKSENDGTEFSHAKIIQKASIMPVCEKCQLSEEYTNLRIFAENEKVFLFYLLSNNSLSDLY